MELFRPVLTPALRTIERWTGGRPPFDAVLKFKTLDQQAQHGLSFEQTERLVRDRLSWMRFCGLTIADRVPDANTLWDFREALILDRQGITVDESPHVYFTTNQTVFRAEFRVGFTAARTPLAFNVIGGAGLANG